MVALIDALVLRLTPSDTRRAMLEMRAAAAGSLAPGRINKPSWGKQSPTTFADEGYAKLALMFRCVGITSTSLAKAQLKVKQEQADGSTKDLPTHPMRVLMKQPNPQMRENRFLATVGMMASIAGFVVIEKERNNRGDVIALWPLEPHRCFPILRNQAPADWEYRVPRISEPFRLKAEDVIVYTYADRPDLAPYGIGPVEACFREVGISNIMTDFLKAFFDTGAQPQHGLVLDKGVKVTPEKADDIKTKWGRRHGGLLKSIEPALLEGIIDVKRLSFDMNELAYQSLRDLTDVAICQAFGVSPLLVDAMAGMARSTFSNHEDARKGFYDETVGALWARLDDVLTLGLLREFPNTDALSLEFDTSNIDALQPDRDKKAPWVISAFSAGLLSNHQALKELDIAVPGVDDWYNRSISVDAIPADDPLGLAQAEQDAELAAKIAAATPKQLPATTDPVPEDPTAQDEGRALAIILEHRGRSGPRERRAAIGVVNRRHIKRIAEKSEPWLRSFFKAQGERLLKTATRSMVLVNGNGAHDQRSVAEIDWDHEARELRKVTEKLYVLSGRTAYDAVNTALDVGISFDLANPELGNVRDLLAKQVKDITDESRTQIAEIVTNANQDGLSLDQLTAQLTSKFEDWTTSRAATVARTESMLSFGHASAAGFRESGVVDRIQCFDNPNHESDYGAEDGLSCAARDGFVDTLDSAELHLRSEHPNGSLAIAPILTGEEV